MKRPALQSIRGFVVWSTGLLILLGAIDRLWGGDGLAGVGEVIFGFLWLGWIVVVGAVPVWLVFRWLLGRYGPRLRGRIRWRGAIVGLLWWLLVATIVLVIELVTWRFSPDSQPTSATVVRAVLGFTAFGALLGFLEGRAIERQTSNAPGA